MKRTNRPFDARREGRSVDRPIFRIYDAAQHERGAPCCFGTRNVQVDVAFVAVSIRPIPSTRHACIRRNIPARLMCGRFTASRSSTSASVAAAVQRAVRCGQCLPRSINQLCRCVHESNCITASDVKDVPARAVRWACVNPQRDTSPPRPVSTFSGPKVHTCILLVDAHAGSREIAGAISRLPASRRERG